MLDHMHLLTNCPNDSADVLRYIKGKTGRRVIDYLKEKNFHSSLNKLQHEEWRRKHSHSVWQKEKSSFDF
jgi:REP element-mobilizing transposase RayT